MKFKAICQYFDLDLKCLMEKSPLQRKISSLGLMFENAQNSSEQIHSHHFVQRVEFTVAFLHRVLPAVHQHVNLEDLKGAKC